MQAHARTYEVDESNEKLLRPFLNSGKKQLVAFMRETPSVKPHSINLF